MSIVNKVVGLLGGSLSTNKCTSDVICEAETASYPMDLRITCASNGYVITSFSGSYDIANKYYVAANEEQLTETILLALVNRKIEQR